MTTRRRARALVAAGVLAVAMTTLGPVQAHEWGRRPFTAEDFVLQAPRGFGDPNNTWAQSMVWWRHALYVGTTRQSLCTSLFAIWQFFGGIFGQLFADTWLPYPPRDHDLPCPLFGADLLVQAEIWRWTPRTNWMRVFQSPLDLDNPGPGGPDPFPLGRKVPYEIGIRGLAPHKEPDGTEALYAFGVNSTVMWDRSKLPPPRILRSTDGLTFTPIPQNPGTFLGDLPFNPDHSSFRSPTSYAGRLFVLAGPIFGQGSLIASADPAKGDDAWFLASPSDVMFFEMEVFNGWLYLGTFDPFGGGYSVVKTRATGQPPYEFITVVPPGAYLPVRPSKSVVSMHEYAGRLYVGTGTQTELIRINPDDTWDLVVGPPRIVPSADGGSEWKFPLSGLDAGFGHSLNDHAWRMEDASDVLYIGTYNASIGSKDDPVNGPLLEHNMGAHLYRTSDGWYYSAITTNGFANPLDPSGGPFDYGIRTIVSTPYGMFLGTANDHHGLGIFRARSARSRGWNRWDRPEIEPGADDGPTTDRAVRRRVRAPDPPDRLEIEPTRSGAALLSWEWVPRAKRYQIWRAEVSKILVRDDLNFEAWNGVFGNKIPDTYVGPYEQIGVTEHSVFIDSTVQLGRRHIYYVVAESRHGEVSDASNLAAFPLITPPMTFAQLVREVDRMDRRERFRNGVKRLTRVRQQIELARSRAERCRLWSAIGVLESVQAWRQVLEPEATDLEILTSKLVRRLLLFVYLPQVASSDEFCTS